MKSTILVVEDDKELQLALKETLVLAKYAVVTADSAENALQVLHTQPVDLVLSDINMGGITGLQLQLKIRIAWPGTPVILMTAYGSIQDSVLAMKGGASDYLVKPFAPALLLETVARFVNFSPVKDSKVKNTDSEFLPIAQAQSSKELFRLANKIAGSDASVLISGESGTGKEVLARFIHIKSPRHSGPFVAINCAAIPENMLEAMLFGHEKGAFTGAHSANQGKFEQANGGTLLLDEVTEMALPLQAKLLRVLQEREVERIGGKSTISLDIRVIATSNRDLRRVVEEGNFREDLYYRLSVFPLQWLALRDRVEDIEPLAKSLLLKHSRKMGQQAPVIEDTAIAAMRNYPWPGNVRELENVIQRALVLKESEAIAISDLGLSSLAQPNSHSGTELARELGRQVDGHVLTSTADSSHDEISANLLGSDLKRKEYEIILAALKENHGKRKKTAEFLGISARTLRYKMAQIRESGVNIDTMISA